MTTMRTDQEYERMYGENWRAVVPTLLTTEDYRACEGVQPITRMILGACTQPRPTTKVWPKEYDNRCPICRNGNQHRQSVHDNEVKKRKSQEKEGLKPNKGADKFVVTPEGETVQDSSGTGNDSVYVGSKVKGTVQGSTFGITDAKGHTKHAGVVAKVHSSDLNLDQTVLVQQDAGKVRLIRTKQEFSRSFPKISRTFLPLK